MGIKNYLFGNIWNATPILSILFIRWDSFKNLEVHIFEIFSWPPFINNIIIIINSRKYEFSNILASLINREMINFKLSSAFSYWK